MALFGFYIFVVELIQIISLIQVYIFLFDLPEPKKFKKDKNAKKHEITGFKKLTKL